MNVELINPFLEATINVIQTMASTPITPGKPSLKSGNRTWGVVSGMIGMAGPKTTGNLVLSFEEQVIVAIVNRMLGENYTGICDEIVDAVGEITNMVSGGAKAALNEKGLTFDMSTPLMIVGKDKEMSQLTKTPVIIVPFTTAEGKFVIEATLCDKK